MATAFFCLAPKHSYVSFKLHNQGKRSPIILCDIFCYAFLNVIQGLTSCGYVPVACLLLKVCRISTTQVLPQGWALRSSKKSTRVSEAQRWYLESKFKVGQETGLKPDPMDVARDMRYARNQQGAKLFTVDEFLTAQQI